MLTFYFAKNIDQNIYKISYSLFQNCDSSAGANV